MTYTRDWQLRIGDILYRRALSVPGEHHGVYLGNGRVLDIQKSVGGAAVPRLITLVDFAAGQRVSVRRRPAAVSEGGVITRARQLLSGGPIPYRLLNANCQHVAAWVQREVWQSRQADDAKGLLAFGGFVALVAVLAMAADGT